MKKLSFIDKILFFVNSILAFLLLISFSSYYISPNTMAFISIISLSVPVLIILNILFIIYWLVSFKRQFLISLLVLIIGFQYVVSFFRINEKKVLLSDDLKVMTYNVRMFNLYDWINKENIDKEIYSFIKTKDPDILSIQEYHQAAKNKIDYPYQFINQNNHSGQAIYSKLKIINSGSLNFSNTGNNAIFIDVVKDNDTLRVYNVHLESLRINPKEEEISQKNSKHLIKRLEKGFKAQANQASLILQHQEKINFKSIICGDFNNTAFSWVYKNLKKGKKDAFEEAGIGFGSTYKLKFPLRIDFILADETIEINNFKTYDVDYSDHSPIMARVNFN